MTHELNRKGFGRAKCRRRGTPADGVIPMDAR